MSSMTAEEAGRGFACEDINISTPSVDTLFFFFFFSDSLSGFRVGPEHGLDHYCVLRLAQVLLVAGKAMGRSPADLVPIVTRVVKAS